MARATETPSAEMWYCACMCGGSLSMMAWTSASCSSTTQQSSTKRRAALAQTAKWWSDFCLNGATLTCTIVKASVAISASSSCTSVPGLKKGSAKKPARSIRLKTSASSHQRTLSR